jgi:hypothetical protein
MERYSQGGGEARNGIRTSDLEAAGPERARTMVPISRLPPLSVLSRLPASLLYARALSVSSPTSRCCRRRCAPRQTGRTLGSLAMTELCCGDVHEPRFRAF